MDIPEIDLKIKNVGVTSALWKLKAKWAPNVQQDLHAYDILGYNDKRPYSIECYLDPYLPSDQYFSDDGSFL